MPDSENEHTLILMDLKDHEWELTCNINYRPQYQEKCPECGGLCIWAKQKKRVSHEIPRQETATDV